MSKSFLPVTYYSLRWQTVQSTMEDYTVRYSGSYSPLAETVVSSLIKELTHKEEKP